MKGWEFGAGLAAGIVLTLCVYLFLMTNRREKPLKGFLGWLRNFFTFRKIYIEAILRFLYILTTCIIFAIGFFRIFEKGWRGLVLMIAGPVIVRIAYEILMLGIIAVKNIMEINRYLQGDAASSVIIADPDAFNEALQKRADELGEVFEKKEEPAAAEKDEEPEDVENDEVPMIAETDEDPETDRKDSEEAGDPSGTAEAEEETAEEKEDPAEEKEETAEEKEETAEEKEEKQPGRKGVPSF